MAAITYTFLDAQQNVWTLLHGQKFASTDGGVSTVKDAINRAQAEVPVILGELAYAGGLYSSPAPYSCNGSADTFSFSTDGILHPCVVEIKKDSTVYVSAHYAKPERLLQMSRTLVVTDEYTYSFLGTNILVRPVPPNGGSVTLHAIKVPTALSADGDLIAADPRTFRAICLRAAWHVIQKFPSEQPGRFDQLQKDFSTELDALRQALLGTEAEEYSQRTGRDLTFQGAAPGQGG